MALSQTLETYLADHQTPYRVEHHPLALSSLGTARVARVDERCLAKSVLLEDDDGALLAVLPAARRLEISSVRSALGRRLRFACEESTETHFPDCAIGALPPLGMAFGLQTVVDHGFESLREIYFEGGDHESLVRMSGASFLDLMQDAQRAAIATESPGWIEARRARERLYGSVLRVSEALTAPIGSGERWRRRLCRELDALRRALASHIAQSEAAEGLLRQIEEQAPRLARAVDRLRLDHDELVDGCNEMLLRIEDPDSPEALRRHTLSLLGRFAKHRHRGADIVYEAYGVDIGGG